MTVSNKCPSVNHFWVSARKCKLYCITKKVVKVNFSINFVKVLKIMTTKYFLCTFCWFETGEILTKVINNYKIWNT